MPEYDLGGNHARRGQYAGIRGQLRWNRQRSAYNERQIPEPRIIGLDLRPRSHLNSLAMHFMVLGTRVLCLRAHLREQDPAWGVLAKAGFKNVVHVPSVPLTIREEDLYFAKGK